MYWNVKGVFVLRVHFPECHTLHLAVPESNSGNVEKMQSTAMHYYSCVDVDLHRPCVYFWKSLSV